MNPDDTVRANRPDEEPEPAATVSGQRPDNEIQATPQSEPARDETDAEPIGWSGRLRQIMRRSAQGEARTNIKRQQLREDRTKAFPMLAGSTVVLGLMFFGLFSSPSSNDKNNSARPGQPNLGRGPSGESIDNEPLGDAFA